jgi:helix-turn-helix protein
MAAKSKILPRDRLAWHDQMCRDRELSNVTFRVGVHIGAHFNNITGSTFISYVRIAEDLDLGRATVGAAIRELRRRGHLDVRAQGGGRGRANVYGMILKSVQDSGRFDSVQTVQNKPENRPACQTPTLTSPSEKDSSRGRDALVPEKRGDIHAFVLEDSSEAREWSDYLRGRGLNGTLLWVLHEGKRGAWMSSPRPPQSEHPHNRPLIGGLSDEQTGSEQPVANAHNTTVKTVQDFGRFDAARTLKLTHKRR